MNRPSPSHPDRKRAYHHGRLREAAVRRAREVVVNGGPLALTLRGVARDLGVTAPALVYHFGSLRGLRAATAAAVLEDAASASAVATAPATTPIATATAPVAPAAASIATAPPAASIATAPATAVETAPATAVETAPATAPATAPWTAVETAPATAVETAPATAVAPATTTVALAPPAAAALPPARPPAPDARSIGVGWIAFAAANPNLYRLASGEGWHGGGIATRGLHGTGQVVPSPRRALQSGLQQVSRRLGRPRGDEERAAQLAISIHGLALARLDGVPEPDVLVAIERMFAA